MKYQLPCWRSQKEDERTLIFRLFRLGAGCRSWQGCMIYIGQACFLFSYLTQVSCLAKEKHSMVVV